MRIAYRFPSSFNAASNVARCIRFAGLVFVLIGVFSTAAMADGAQPFRAARLTYLQGDVHVEQAHGAAKNTSVLNMPLVEGAVVSTGQDGQAEVEFEDGSLVRLTPNSGISLINLSLDSSGIYQTHMALTGGLAYLELRAGTKFQYSLDAGGDVISPVENATIRVNLDEPPAVIAILDGTVHIAEAAGTDVDATAGQTVRMDPAYKGQLYQVKQAIAPESWDRWNEDRDEAAASESGSQTDARSKFAGDQGYGWSDLDANGSWYDVPGHGQVWQPDVAAQNDAEMADGEQPTDAGAESTFDPYGFGSWAWTPAGYAWASGYGWGWLPYRCGRWSYWNGFGWGWSPASSCGVYGFGDYGYGVSIGRAPRWYRRPGRPVPGPGTVHPILTGRGKPVAAQTAFRGEARTIAGNTVEPLPPIGGGYKPRGGSAIGWGLRRDYPIDATTHEAVNGLVATRSAPVFTSNARTAWRSAGTADRSSDTAGQRPTYAVRPSYASPTRAASSPVPPNRVYPDQAGRPIAANRPSLQGQQSMQRQPPVAGPRSAPAYTPAPSAPASHASAPAASSSSSSHGH